MIEVMFPCRPQRCCQCHHHRRFDHPRARQTQSTAFGCECECVVCGYIVPLSRSPGSSSQMRCVDFSSRDCFFNTVHRMTELRASRAHKTRFQLILYPGDVVHAAPWDLLHVVRRGVCASRMRSQNPTRHGTAPDDCESEHGSTTAASQRYTQLARPGCGGSWVADRLSAASHTRGQPHDRERVRADVEPVGEAVHRGGRKLPRLRLAPWVRAPPLRAQLGISACTSMGETPGAEVCSAGAGF